jgi:hypothetical protein
LSKIGADFTYNHKTFKQALFHAFGEVDMEVKKKTENDGRKKVQGVKWFPFGCIFNAQRCGLGRRF